MPIPNNNELEDRIISVAKALFVKKGFDETSMSDIAAEVGISRPALHYYFRTKDRMFQAVFGDILQSLVPHIKEIIIRDSPLMEKLSEVLDIYIAKFSADPYLPAFMIMELQRDAGHVIWTARQLQMVKYIRMIRVYLESEMQKGNIRRVPLFAVAFTFYGLLSFPFLGRNLVTGIFNEDFGEILRQWKPYILMQMRNLLSVEKE